MRIVYMTDDGKRFEDEDKAIKYEEVQEKKRKIISCLRNLIKQIEECDDISGDVNYSYGVHDFSEYPVTNGVTFVDIELRIEDKE